MVMEIGRIGFNGGGINRMVPGAEIMRTGFNSRLAYVDWSGGSAGSQSTTPQTGSSVSASIDVRGRTPNSAQLALSVPVCSVPVYSRDIHGNLIEEGKRKKLSGIMPSVDKFVIYEQLADGIKGSLVTEVKLRGQGHAVKVRNLQESAYIVDAMRGKDIVLTGQIPACEKPKAIASKHSAVPAQKQWQTPSQIATEQNPLLYRAASTLLQSAQIESRAKSLKITIDPNELSGKENRDLRRALKNQNFSVIVAEVTGLIEKMAGRITVGNAPETIEIPDLLPGKKYNIVLLHGNLTIQRTASTRPESAVKAKKTLDDSASAERKAENNPEPKKWWQVWK